MTGNTGERKMQLFITIVLLAILGSYFLIFMDRIPGISLERITGRAVTSVNVTGVTFMNCSYEIPEGMSIFSAYCIGTEHSLAEFFVNVSALEYVMAYRTNDPNGDHWKSYNPGLPSWVVQDLSLISRRKGYVVKLSRPHNFSYYGALRVQDEIPVVQGWNLVGYPRDVVASVNETFASVLGSYQAVVGYNRTLQQYVTYVPGLENNSLNYTVPFQGYWINMTAAGTIIISN